MEKIRHRWEMRPILKGRGKIVATCGCFDVLHVGHKRLLEAARRLGDCLVVAINDDASVHRIKGEGRPMIPLAERCELLAAWPFVDFIVPYQGDTAENILTYIQPDVFVKGDNLSIDEIPERSVVEEYGGEVRLLPIAPDVQSRELVGAIGPKDEIKHAGFTLYDPIEKEWLSSSEVEKQGIVLTAQGKLMWVDGGINWDVGGQPRGMLLKRDVSKRFGLAMRVAGG